PIIMLHSSHYLPHLHSFPTRRSSDLSIGEVAKYQNISKQTLIFYDKVGLFRPAWVDPENGYRYYSASQLDYLDTILIMKQIGFSDRKSTRLNSSHVSISYAVFCLKKK